MVIFYLGLFVLSYLPAVTPIPVSDAWDYALLIRLNETGNGYDFPGQLVWEGRGDVTALPGRVFHNNKTFEIEDRGLVAPCCKNWTKSGWIKVKDDEAASTAPLLQYTSKSSNTSGPPAEIWGLEGEKGFMYSEDIPSSAFKYNRNNITAPVTVAVIAHLSIDASIEVSLERSDGSDKQSLGEIIGSADDTWILKRLHIQNANVKRNTTVRISLTAKQPKDWVTPVLIQWISISTPAPHKDFNIGAVHSVEEIKDTYYAPLTRAPSIFVQDSVCMHGGALDIVAGHCKCPTGFAGTVCERGCGPNKYGTNCGGQCSKESDNKECRGVLSCSKDAGCQCMAGLQGTYCDQTCHFGWYGASCQQKCGHCVGNETCDRYTGRCDSGCEDGFQPPFCQSDACGVSPSGLSDLNDPEIFFWHSAIYEKISGIFKAVCSGSLIAPRFLISAAWCFYSERTASLKSPSRFIVLFGTEERFSFTDLTYPRAVQAQSVLSVHVPSLYRGESRSYSDDIALVELSRPVRPDPFIAPVCLDTAGDDDLLDGDAGFVAGWGSLKSNCTNCTRSGAEFEYITHSSCLSEVSEKNLLAVGPGKFCGVLSSGDSDTEESTQKPDPSDVGSGFLLFKNGAGYLYGVKSGAPPDVERKRRISFYTSVPHYGEWITKTRKELDVMFAVEKNT